MYAHRLVLPQHRYVSREILEPVLVDQENLVSSRSGTRHFLQHTSCIACVTRASLLGLRLIFISFGFPTIPLACMGASIVIIVLTSPYSSVSLGQVANFFKLPIPAELSEACQSNKLLNKPSHGSGQGRTRRREPRGTAMVAVERQDMPNHASTTSNCYVTLHVLGYLLLDSRRRRHVVIIFLHFKAEIELVSWLLQRLEVATSRRS